MANKLPKMNIILAVTHRCNLSCKYCYGGEKFNRSMDEAIGKKGIDLGLSMAGGKTQISFFGGEPILELELIEKLARYGRQKAEEKGLNPHFQMTTNGTLLTDKNLDMLSELLISIAVSIDGDREAHDYNRVFAGGEGSHAAVEEGLKRALKRWPWISTLSVLTPENISRWPESFEYLYSLGCRKMHFSVDYSSKWSDKSLDIYDQKAFETADLWLGKLRQNVDVRVSVFNNKIITHLKDGLDDCDLCEFGMGEIAVAPSGNLYPCDRLIGEDDKPQYIIGTVDKGLDYKKVLALKAHQKKPPAICAECAYADRCVNYCGCVNHALTGRHDIVSGDICRFEQAAIENADRIAAILYEEKNPIFMERFYNSLKRREELR